MNDSTNDSENKFIQEKITENIWKIIPPIFIFVGTIGNLLSVIVLTRPKIVKSTSALYLIVLAFSDTLVLYTGLMRHWIEHAFDWNIRHYNEAGCKIHVFMTYLSLDFSAWLLVAVTFDRLVLVWFPYTAKRKCTKSAGSIIIFIIFMILATVNGHIFYGHGDKYTTKDNITMVEKCEYSNEEYEVFFNETWPWIDFATFCLIPFCVLLVGNSLICIKILSWRKARNRRTSSQNKNGGCQPTRMSSITIMLFTLNTVFLLCTTPISIFNINDSHVKNLAGYDLADHDLKWSICNILMYGNNTFNFLLYIFSGSRFRNEAKSFLCQYFIDKNCMSNPYTARTPIKDDITHDDAIL